MPRLTRHTTTIKRMASIPIMLLNPWILMLRIITIINITWSTTTKCLGPQNRSRVSEESQAQ